jgi:RNase P subunit RPR2
MAHQWGEMPGEGPIARRLRLLTGKEDRICAHCGAYLDAGIGYGVAIARTGGPAAVVVLCESCGMQMRHWLCLGE